MLSLEQINKATSEMSLNMFKMQLISMYNSPVYASKRNEIQQRLDAIERRRAAIQDYNKQNYITGGPVGDFALRTAVGQYEYDKRKKAKGQPYNAEMFKAQADQARANTPKIVQQSLKQPPADVQPVVDKIIQIVDNAKRSNMTTAAQKALEELSRVATRGEETFRNVYRLLEANGRGDIVNLAVNYENRPAPGGIVPTMIVTNMVNRITNERL